MKMAVALFGNRISPHFGSSPRVLLLEVENGVIRQKSLKTVGAKGPMEMARRLVELGVERLICGGILRSCKEWLIAKGVSVLDNQKGKAEELLKNVLEPKNNKGIAFQMGQKTPNRENAKQI
jgi:predicted Fe-Mo cluster-binding NifX family protein